MVTSQVFTTQTQLGSPSPSRSLTVFSPPGIFMETSKFPIVNAGILASTRPSEWLSIFDHPEAWRGLDRDAIISMRRQLYRFILPLDGRELTPRDAVEVLQTLALAVSPVAVEVLSDDLPSPRLHINGGLLPSGPAVRASSFEIVSEPEISKVAKRITEKDIPASEAIWSLLDFDYTLDQVARLMSVGLLGRIENRRMVPLRSAYKATIDSYISRCVMELTDCPDAAESRLYMSSFFGDSFTILSVPGESRVDYLRMEKTAKEVKRGVSLEDLRHTPTDSKTAVFADHARFSAYSAMNAERLTSHIIIFHFSRNARSNSLGPWISRAGVREALQSTPVLLENRGNAMAVLNSVLRPELGRWAADTPILERMGLKEAAHPLVHTTP
ncbi:MAG: hypothetical protein ACFFD6_10705 [Candidatus Thorarchaeota archaeon]